MAYNDLNRLIVMSGMNAPSPVRSYYEGSDARQREAMNKLSMQSTEQQMDINRQRQEQANQDRQARTAATYMQSVLKAPADKRISAYEEAKKRLMLDHGIPSPEKYDENAIMQLLSYSNMPTYMAPEKMGDRSYVQTEAVTGKTDKILSESEGYAGVGGSAYERVIARLEAANIPVDSTDAEIDAMPNLTRDQKGLYKNLVQRAQTLSGTDWSYGEGMRHGRLRERDVVSDREQVWKDYSDRVESYTGMNRSIESAKAALESGDTQLSDRLLNSVLSQVQDNNIRAMAMYSEFEKPFGNLIDRTVSQINRFFMGGRTDSERAEIMETLNYLQNAYVEPHIIKNRQHSRNMATQRGLKRWETIPPDGSEADLQMLMDDVKRGLIPMEEAETIAKLYYPGRFD